MQFLKGHATGNDFIILPDPDGTLVLTADDVRWMCDRREGLGADGVLHVAPTTKSAPRWAQSAPWYLDHWNADGSTSPMCGNGLRLQGRYLVAANWAEPGSIQIATPQGVREVDVPATGAVTVQMGEPTFKRAEAALPDRMLIGLGNLHEVTIVERLPETGELVGSDEHNTEYAQVLSSTHLKMRVVERGVGETLSCGSGACAAVAAAARMRHLEETVAVETRGGILHVTQRGGQMVLTGDAVLVAEGHLKENVAKL